MKVKNPFIIFFVACAVLFFMSLMNAYAGEKHHRSTTQIVTKSESVSDIALAVAAGQHNYKATSAFQWSVGAGYVDNSSAVSFGLGKQTGKVFISGNFSSDGRTSAIGFGASGTF